MRVVLQSNLDPQAGLVNGSQGALIDFEEYDPKRLPRKPENRNDPGELNSMSTGTSLRGTHAKYCEQQIQVFAKENKYQPWPIVRFDNGLTRTIYADCTANELGNEEPYSLLSRTQIPLMAGYAITIHKSQVRFNASVEKDEPNFLRTGHDTRPSNRRPCQGFRAESDLCCT